MSMKFYVYILFASDNKLYIGYSTDLRQRIKSHNAGRVTSTKHRGSLKLIHYEYFINKADAKAREIFLKSGAGHEQINQFLKRTLPQLKSQTKLI